MASPRTSRLRTPVLLVGAVAMTGALINVASAATPGTLALGPDSGSKSWKGKAYTMAVPDPAACLSKSEDPGDLTCDHLTVTATGGGTVDVSIKWADAVNDWDLYVYKGSTLVASSAQGGTTTEKASFSQATGTYEVRVVPYAVAQSAYDGQVAYTKATATSQRLSGPAQYRGTRILGANPDKEPQNVKMRATKPPLVLKSTNVGRKAAEPTIGIDRKGRAWYAAADFDGPGGLADTRIRRSVDGNRTWQDKTPPNSLPVTLDPYIYVEEDSGRVFDLDLYVGSAFLSFTDDGGKTWETNPATSGTSPVNDHQTLFAGPPPAGFDKSLLTDPKFQEILYYCFNRVSDSSCTRSFDGGRTFTNAGIAYPGVNPAIGEFCGGLHGHVATDRRGYVFVPRGYCDAGPLDKPFVSISKDAGLTFERVKVSDTVDMPDNQSSIASDAQNNLYYAWYDSKHKLPYLATSRDGGQTWSKPLMVAPPGVREVQWPTVYAGANGRIAIGFPGTNVADMGDKTRPWDHHIVVSDNALADNPVFVSNISNKATDPVHRGDCPGRCGNMLDFLDVVIAPVPGPGTGPVNPVWATVVDTCTAVRQCNSTRQDGFVDGGGDGVSADMQGIAVKQVGGINLGW